VFDHVTIAVGDRAASRRFYEAALGAIGVAPPQSTRHYDEWTDFSIAPASEKRPLTRRLHIAFGAPSRDAVDAFWQMLTSAGYRDDGAPGPRPQYRPDYYGAFVLDPDGNSAEAVHHGETRTDGWHIDHLWLRVRDVAATRRFYDAVAPALGLRRGHDSAERVQYIARGASSSWVAGDEPTEHVHLAFQAADRAAVDAFHRAATEAGFRDRGAPGERTHYHPAYYAAYVLDPDGHNVEAVFHDRSGVSASAPSGTP
jgi:catechol 2,3-dioxygenase-like lactoylglutathione lyase family enzyme